ncbi:MAG: hypothetical protein LW834_08070 [Cyanobium sp. 49614_E6]|nr:hypothetical protein [Cyanobium sp. 49614_E6]
MDVSRFPSLLMAPSLGWHDPIWQRLYAAPAQAQSPAPAPQPQDSGTVHYLDQLQAAAAAGQTFNLSDLPGFQANLAQPTDG